MIAHADDPSEWGGAWSDHYAAVLTNATYALCPGGAAPHASERLRDAIRADSIPILVDDPDLALPFSGLEDVDGLWAACAVRVRPEHLAGAVFLKALEAPEEVAARPARRAACAELRARYLADDDVVLDAALRSLGAPPGCDAPRLPRCRALRGGSPCSDGDLFAERERVRACAESQPVSRYGSTRAFRNESLGTLSLRASGNYGEPSNRPVPTKPRETSSI